MEKSEVEIPEILKDLTLTTSVEQARYGMDGYVTIILEYKGVEIASTSFSSSDLVRLEN